MADEKSYQFCHGKVLLGHEFRSQDLWVKNGKIVAPQSKADVTVDVHGAFIAPGYIDLQINGAFGVDFSSAAERVKEVAEKLPGTGVTSFLPTLVSSSPETYQKMIPHLSPTQVENGASILGVHLEGPFFSREKYGAHSPDLIRSLDPQQLKMTYGNLEGVRIVTLAPELPGASEVIAYLKKNGIIVSAGHSSATYEQALQAVQQGVSFATHLYNAMKYDHRNPGIPGVFLTNDLFYSVIADGVHVHPAMVKQMRLASGQKMVLVTDAISALGWKPGTYDLGSMKVTVDGEKAVISGTSTLAGSILTLDQAVRNLLKFTNCPPAQALEAASLHPAQVLGLKNKGNLNEGSDADFLILNQKLQVKETYVAGKNVYSSH